MPHWREHLGSPLLGAYSLYDDAKDDFIEKDGIITHCGKADFMLGESGKQNCLVAYTNLGKPLKINVTIADTLQSITGKRNPDKWVNVPVTFYVDRKVKGKKGATVEAIRVKQCRNNQAIANAENEAKLRNCKTLEELKAVYTAPGFPQSAMAAIKDEVKKIITDGLQTN